MNQLIILFIIYFIDTNGGNRMITAIDFSEYELNGKYYGGSERKEGITIDDEDYMIKFQKQAYVKC